MCGVIRNLATVLFVLTLTALIAAEEQESATVPTTDSNAGTVDSSLAPELPVKAWRILGTGRADAASQSINPPDALAFTPDGLLLATDAKNHRVQMFDPMSGTHLGSFGGVDVFPGEVVGIAVMPNGSIFVSDDVNNQLRVNPVRHEICAF